MKYTPAIHTRAMLLKSVIGGVLKAFGDLNYSAGELLVVNYHSTPKKFIPDFVKQIEFLQSKFDIIAPAELPAYYSASKPTGRCKLLLTFDDGLKNNLYAAEALHALGLRAFYFVIPQFIETPEQLQKDYYLTHIRPVVNQNIDSEREDFEAMSWADVKTLANEGNFIGSHTYTHTMLASENSPDVSERELVLSREFIRSKTGVSVNAFCSINNTLLSVNKISKQTIAQNYNYHFTTLPGLNGKNKNPLFIKRRNIECFWPDGATFFALGKMDLKRWQSRIESYENL